MPGNSAVSREASAASLSAMRSMRPSMSETRCAASLIFEKASTAWTSVKRVTLTSLCLIPCSRSAREKFVRASAAISSGVLGALGSVSAIRGSSYWLSFMGSPFRLWVTAYGKGPRRDPKILPGPFSTRLSMPREAGREVGLRDGHRARSRGGAARDGGGDVGGIGGDADDLQEALAVDDGDLLIVAHPFDALGDVVAEVGGLPELDTARRGRAGHLGDGDRRRGAVGHDRPRRDVALGEHVLDVGVAAVALGVGHVAVGEHSEDRDVVARGARDATVDPADAH